MSLADEDRGYEVPPPAVPVPGCGQCATLAGRRAEASSAGDRSGVTDAVVLLRAHLAAAH